MARLWKLDGGILVKPPAAMDDNEARTAGYKELEWTLPPDDDNDYQSVWEEREHAIVQTWTPVPIEI